MRFDLQGEATPSALLKTDVIDNVEVTNKQAVTVDRNIKVMPLKKAGTEIGYKIESRATGADIAIRSMQPGFLGAEPDK